jgi:Fur family ferric uptake transcriptional regulator
MAAPGPGRPRGRNTAKQRLVFDVLCESERFRSAQQVYLEIRQRSSVRIGLTTVYRILHTLADDRVAETQRAEDGETLYRLRSSGEHRHYLICRGCGRAVAFTPVALEECTSELTAQHQFTEVTHHIDVYGICPQCRS